MTSTVTKRRIQQFIDDNVSDAFPNNICEIFHMSFDLLALDLNIVDRMPDDRDSNYTVGIVPVSRAPKAETAEIRGPLSFVGMTVSEYLIVIYAFVKDVNRARGAAAHAVLSEIVEHTLETDLAVRQSLGLLESNVLGTRKRFQRHYIRQSRYLANEIDGANLFMTATEVIAEVEKVA